MKKIFLTAAMMTAIYGVAAQAPHIYPMPQAESVNAPEYLQPYTTVVVRVTVQEETFTAGPYARYAQKYLGTMASVADRNEFRILKVEMDYEDPTRNFSAAKGGKVVTGAKPALKENTQAKAVPDRVSLQDRTSEEMARDAANALYTLRKRRFDLVTGEAGENVYGQGMKAALKEMDRMEEEYLSLFLGSETGRITVREFRVVPRGEKNNYVVCRFDPESGVVPETDLSGRPIALVLTPENTVTGAVAAKSGKGVEYYRVAEWTNCRVLDGSTELAAARFPVYQFGKTVTGPAQR